MWPHGELLQRIDLAIVLPLNLAKEINFPVWLHKYWWVVVGFFWCGFFLWCFFVCLCCCFGFGCFFLEGYRKCGRNVQRERAAVLVEAIC